jgi:membrane associated rhomboid family serine protease
MNLRALLNYMLVGALGGLLIFMGMLMFNTLLNLLFPTNQWTMLELLCFTSLVVGMLARLLQPFHGLGSAIASGVIAALMILYLWLVPSTATTMDLVFGPLGILVTIGFSILGAWVLPVLRNRNGRRVGKTS